MKELYLALCARIAEKLPSIGWIDLFNDQFTKLEQGEELPIPLPAVMIELQVDWTANGNGLQSGNCRVVLHVGQELYTDSYYGSPDQSRALEVLDLLQSLYTHLQGFEQPGFSALERTQNEQDTNYGNLVVHKITFSTQLVDNSRSLDNRYQKLTPDLILKKNILPD